MSEPADNSRLSGAERQPHASDPNRWADGSFRVGGDGGNLQHGVRRYELRGVLPDTVREHVAAFERAVVTDRGGAAEMSAIEVGYARRLAQLEAALELLGIDISARGVMTQRGRPRAAYNVFLATLATWDRLAQRLGTERRPAPIQTVADILAEYARRDAAAPHRADAAPDATTRPVDGVRGDVDTDAPGTSATSTGDAEHGVAPVLDDEATPTATLTP